MSKRSIDLGLAARWARGWVVFSLDLISPIGRLLFILLAPVLYLLRCILDALYMSLRVLSHLEVYLSPRPHPRLRSFLFLILPLQML